MRKLIIVLFMLFFCISVFADFPPVHWTEFDTDPSVYPTNIIMPAGSLSTVSTGLVVTFGSGGSESTTVSDTATIDLTLTGSDITGDVITLKDLVTTAPITGGTDNILVGADADITIALTQLKDIVTTAPLTGGENDVLPGADADLTLAITVAKDIVAGVGLSGGEDNVLPGADADTTLTFDATELSDLTWGAAGGAFSWTFNAGATDPKMTFDSDGNIGIGITNPAYLLEVEGTFDATTITQAGTGVAISGGAFHDGFSDFVSNEHIDHTAVTLTAGVGLSGGGDISANRTFTFDATELDALTWDAGTLTKITWTWDTDTTDPTMTFENSGMIGIGTTNPTQALEVNGSVKATSFIGNLTGNADTVTTNANLTGDVTSTGNATDITESVLGVGGSDTIFPADPNADRYLMWDDDPGQLSWETVAGSGDITAVGDCADGACFNGTQGTTLTFNNAGGDGILLYDATNIEFSFDKSVGIGTTNPTTALDVVGTVNATALTEGGVAVYNDDEIDTYSEINAIVADVTLTHNGLIDTFAELDAIVADKALVNKADGAVWLGTHDYGGATSTEVENAAGDVTIAEGGAVGVDTTNKQFVVFDGTTEFAIPLRHVAQGTFDLAAQWDVDSDLWLVDLHADQYPNGIYITAIYVDCTVADPTTELDGNLMYCDAVANGAFPGANATLIKAVDTTTGNFSDAAVNTAVATGKTIYLDLDADPTDATTQYHIRIHYYIEED